MSNRIDPKFLLPPEVRRRWVAIPRYRLYQAVAFFFLIGASLALWIVGTVEGIRWMKWTPPLTVLAFVLMNLFLRRKERMDEEEAKRYGVKSSSDLPA